MTPHEKRRQYMVSHFKNNIEFMDASKQDGSIVWDTTLPQFDPVNVFHDFDDVYIIKIMRLKKDKK